MMQSAFTKHHIHVCQSLVRNDTCVQRLSTKRKMGKDITFDWLHAIVKFR